MRTICGGLERFEEEIEPGVGNLSVNMQTAVKNEGSSLAPPGSDDGTFTSSVEMLPSTSASYNLQFVDFYYPPCIRSIWSRACLRGFFFLYCGQKVMKKVKPLGGH